MLTTFPRIQFNLQTHRNTYDEISNDSMFNLSTYSYLAEWNANLKMRLAESLTLQTVCSLKQPHKYLYLTNAMQLSKL